MNRIEAAERTLFDWLALRDPLPTSPCDAVIGFGHFDLAIPWHCAGLVRRGAAIRMIFTGGIGAGTADLGGPEADSFAAELAIQHPDLAQQVVIENRSTNTAENIRFTREILSHCNPPLALGAAIRSVLLVATPCRMRRVALTWRKLAPETPAWSSPPDTGYEALSTLYASKGESIRDQLIGEFDRIRDYPLRGWIAQIEIPPSIEECANIIRNSLRPGAPSANA
ncbi:hypothetical protein Pan44_27520 [Caulifigura coniformis]|uniref:DUF218 domain-containing protein n=1 Tax=Caulifigura coniformis TaxID=2527983 RepID=A0A517SF50_9PLAN|nr:YdcF family protein [Caulifigura coniformis]QDT54717.1 hypothetical protein Pan44_27520 [Caulifigura coniformis]